MDLRPEYVTNISDKVRINWTPPWRTPGCYDICVEQLINGEWDTYWTTCEMSNDYAHTQVRQVALRLASKLAEENQK